MVNLEQAVDAQAAAEWLRQEFADQDTEEERELFELIRPDLIQADWTWVEVSR